MAKFGGFGGGNPMQMQNLMKQAQKMQQEAIEAQQQIDEAILEGTAGGGMVKVQIYGTKKPISVKIEPSVVDPEDVEMLEDLIVAALNDACEKADELKQDKLGKFGSLGGLM